MANAATRATTSTQTPPSTMQIYRRPKRPVLLMWACHLAFAVLSDQDGPVVAGPGETQFFRGRRSLIKKAHFRLRGRITGVNAPLIGGFAASALESRDA